MVLCAKPLPQRCRSEAGSSRGSTARSQQSGRQGRSRACVCCGGRCRRQSKSYVLLGVYQTQKLFLIFLIVLVCAVSDIRRCRRSRTVNAAKMLSRRHFAGSSQTSQEHVCTSELNDSSANADG